MYETKDVGPYKYISRGKYFFRFRLITPVNIAEMAFFAGPIDTILKEKDFTLEKLLDEDELVVEAKKGREDLLQLYVAKRGQRAHSLV